MIISKDTIKQDLITLLKRVYQLPEVNKVQIREIDIFSEHELDKVDNAIEECYHDVLSDIDVGIHVTIHPEDVGNGYGYLSNPERLGLTSEIYLGLASSNSNDGLFQMFRIILYTGTRFDVGFYITVDTTAPIYNVSREIKEEMKDEGKFWPRYDLKKADNFWFVEILSLAKLMRGDYLIADHLANLQINETLVAQMLIRDDLYGTNFHRYGHEEGLDYRLIPSSEFTFSAKDETYDMIANKVLSAAISYDRLVQHLNPLYKERKSTFFEVWKQYEDRLTNAVTII